MKDRLTVVKSAGLLAALGWFWFLGAVATLALVWTAPPDPAVPPDAVMVVSVMVTGIGLLGLVLALARVGVDVDRRRGTVSRWFGLLFPLFARREPLERFDHVLLSKVLRRVRGGVREHYLAQLAGPQVAPLLVERSKDPGAARARTEELGRLLGFGIRDTTGPTPVVREPGTFDESLRTRLRRGGARPAAAERTPGVRTIVARSGDELRLQIPPAGFRPLQVAILTFIAVVTIAAMVIAATLADRANVLPAMAVVAGTGALNFLVPLLVLAAEARAREEVVATPARLQVRQIGLMRSRTLAMAADQIEELEIELGTHARLAARGDQAAVHFGRGLSVAELEWLRSELHGVLTA